MTDRPPAAPVGDTAEAATGADAALGPAGPAFDDVDDRTRGMDITFVTTAKNDDEGRALLRHLGFPFKTN